MANLFCQCRKKMERGEERRPGARPLAGRGVGPEPQRFIQWERLREENFQRIMQRERSRPAVTPRPFIQIHHAYMPLNLPHYPAVRFGQFGYMDPNAPVCPRVNNLRSCLPCPQSNVSPPPLPLDSEASTGSSSKESSDSKEGNSLEANHGSP